MRTGSEEMTATGTGYGRDGDEIGEYHNIGNVVVISQTSTPTYHAPRDAHTSTSAAGAERPREAGTDHILLLISHVSARFTSMPSCQPLLTRVPATRRRQNLAMCIMHLYPPGCFSLLSPCPAGPLSAL